MRACEPNWRDCYVCSGAQPVVSELPDALGRKPTSRRSPSVHGVCEAHVHDLETWRRGWPFVSRRAWTDC